MLRGGSRPSEKGWGGLSLRAPPLERAVQHSFDGRERPIPTYVVTFLFPFQANTMTGVCTAAFTVVTPTEWRQNESFSLPPGNLHMTHLLPNPSILSPLDNRTVDASSTAKLHTSMQVNCFRLVIFGDFSDAVLWLDTNHLL